MNTMSLEEVDRVRRHTADHVNEEIDRRTEENIRSYANKSPCEITQRIRELEDEWDVERVLETNASTLAIIGLVLGATVNRKWLFLTGGVLGFLFLHGTQGWCPPLPVLRRMGIRTRREIDVEKYALKYLRGDFRPLDAPVVPDEMQAEEALAAVAQGA